MATWQSEMEVVEEPASPRWRRPTPLSLGALKDEPGLTTTFCETLQTPSTTCHASDSAADFLDALTPSDLAPLLFRDQLLSVRDANVFESPAQVSRRPFVVTEAAATREEPIGAYHVAVERVDSDILEDEATRSRRPRRSTDWLFRVCIETSGRIDGGTSGMVVESEVDARSLRTLRQRCHEFEKSYAQSLDRYTLVETRSDGAIELNVTTVRDEDTSCNTYNYTASECRGYVSVGAHVLLARHFGRSRTLLVDDDFRVLSFDEHGQVRSCRYEVMPGSEVEHGGQTVGDLTLVASIYDGDGIDMTRVDEFYNARGALVLRRVRNTETRSRVVDLPATEPLSMDQDAWQVEIPFEWQDDAQLVAAYRQNKDALKIAFRQQLQQNGELDALLNDFIVHLAVTQPTDVYEATADWWYEIGEARRGTQDGDTQREPSSTPPPSVVAKRRLRLGQAVRTESERTLAGGELADEVIQRALELYRVRGSMRDSEMPLLP